MNDIAIAMRDRTGIGAPDGKVAGLTGTALGLEMIAARKLERVDQTFTEDASHDGRVCDKYEESSSGQVRGSVVTEVYSTAF